MLIIGHRGAAGEAPENTLEAIKRGIKSDADIIEFDVRITSDGVPVLSHDPHLSRTYGKNLWVRQNTLAKLQDATRDKTPIPTLDQALGICAHKIFVNIEVKTAVDIPTVLDIITKHYSTKKQQSSEFFISSFKPKVLQQVREIWPHAQLALLHAVNPQRFMAWHRRLNLSAVGFHRLHYNRFAIDVAHKLGLFTYIYTVNRNDAVMRARDHSVDGVVTNYPTKMVQLNEKLSD